MNNFQRLQKEDEERYKPTVDQIKTNLDQSMELMRLIGDIVEVFVPRFFDTVVISSGGNASGDNLPNEDGTPPDGGGGSGGPRGPNIDLDSGRPE